METYDRKICKLPGCDNLSPSWRKQFCCASHAAKYGALRNGKNINTTKVVAAPKPKVSKPKSPSKTKDIIVGPTLPRRVRKMLEKGIVVDKRKFMYRIHLVKLATPKWADQTKINELYEQKKLLNNGNNLYHVDHIIPLNHPLVCGLHVETNLRIISKNDNEKKNNKFQIE